MEKLILALALIFSIAPFSTFADHKHANESLTNLRHFQGEYSVENCEFIGVKPGAAVNIAVFTNDEGRSYIIQLSSDSLFLNDTLYVSKLGKKISIDRLNSNNDWGCERGWSVTRYQNNSNEHSIEHKSKNRFYYGCMIPDFTQSKKIVMKLRQTDRGAVITKAFHGGKTSVCDLVKK